MRAPSQAPKTALTQTITRRPLTFNDRMTNEALSASGSSCFCLCKLAASVACKSAVDYHDCSERRKRWCASVNGSAPPLFGDHDLVAFGIADANLTGCALHGKDLHPTVDEALSNSRQAVYLDAKVLDAAAAKRLFFGEHQPHGSVAQQNRAVGLSPYHC